ncbi:hypothetical protein ACOME3_006634 [Neoechinorhynchus agilis]
MVDSNCFAISSALELSKYPTEHVIQTISEISSHKEWNSVIKDLGTSEGLELKSNISCTRPGFVSVLIEIVTSGNLDNELYVKAENLLADLLSNHGNEVECRINAHLSAIRRINRIRDKIVGRKQVRNLERHIDACGHISSSRGNIDKLSILGATKTFTSLIDEICSRSQRGKRSPCSPIIVKSLEILTNLIAQGDKGFIANNAHIITFNSVQCLHAFVCLINHKDERVSSMAIRFFRELIASPFPGLHQILSDHHMDSELVQFCCFQVQRPVWNNARLQEVFEILIEMSRVNSQTRWKLIRNHSFIDFLFLSITMINANSFYCILENCSVLLRIMCESIIKSRSVTRVCIRDRYYLKLLVLLKSPNVEVVLNCLKSIRSLACGSKQISEGLKRQKSFKYWLQALSTSKHTEVASESSFVLSVLCDF